jgi:hypothetical protein
MRSLILERMIWFQAGSITYQLRKHGRLGIQAQPCGTRRCPSSSSKHSNDSTMCSCSEPRSLLASLTNRRRPARHGRPCGGAASACGPNRHRAIARAGGAVVKTDKRLRELKEAVPFLFNMCEYLPQQKWVRGVIYGGEGWIACRVQGGRYSCSCCYIRDKFWTGGEGTGECVENVTHGHRNLDWKLRVQCAHIYA